MSHRAFMNRRERAQRHRELVAEYHLSGVPSRTIASLYGLSDSHVRAVLRLYGVSRKVGRPGR